MPLKRQSQYFVCNKVSDYQRGWCQNIICTDRHIQVADRDKSGIFWSRLLDSREKETVWHRLTMDCKSLGEASVRMTLYCAEDSRSFFNGAERPIAQLLKKPELTDLDRQDFSSAYFVKTVYSPQDILLHELKGRYVWFRVELIPHGGESPQIGNLKLRFPMKSWIDYLPQVYREGGESASFTQRFLGVFQSLHDDLTDDIRNVAQQFDPDVAGGAYLEWLSSWLGVEDGYLWQEDKLRRLIREGVSLYRMRGTKYYVVEMVRLFTGYTPYVVEHGDVEPHFGDITKTALLKELYGDSPYMVTLVLDGNALKSTEEYKALLRIVDSAKPAWLEANVVVLKPYIFLNKYTYLGMNTTLDRYRPLHLDGYSALPFTGLGSGDEMI